MRVGGFAERVEIGQSKVENLRITGKLRGNITSRSGHCPDEIAKSRKMRDVNKLTRDYLQTFKQENERLKRLRAFLDNNQGESLFNRNNAAGHITASAFIVNPTTKKMLLIKHKVINRWLQPGGHVDKSDETLIAAALREVKEETGIDSSDLTLVSCNGCDEVPADIDSHLIAANPNRGESRHYHHDFRYIFLYNGDSKPVLDKNEVTDYQWTSFEKLQSEPIFTRSIEKITKALQTSIQA